MEPSLFSTSEVLHLTRRGRSSSIGDQLDNQYNVYNTDKRHDTLRRLAHLVIGVALSDGRLQSKADMPTDTTVQFAGELAEELGALQPGSCLAEYKIPTYSAKQLRTFTAKDYPTVKPSVTRFLKKPLYNAWPLLSVVTQQHKEIDSWPLNQIIIGPASLVLASRELLLGQHDDSSVSVRVATARALLENGQGERQESPNARQWLTQEISSNLERKQPSNLILALEGIRRSLNRST